MSTRSPHPVTALSRTPATADMGTPITRHIALLPLTILSDDALSRCIAKHEHMHKLPMRTVITAVKEACCHPKASQYRSVNIAELLPIV